MSILNSQFYSIAGHSIAISGGKELTLIENLPGFSVFAIPPTPCSLQIMFSEEAIPINFIPFYTVNFEEGKYHCQLGKVGSDYRFSMVSTDCDQRYLSFTHSEGSTSVQLYLSETLQQADNQEIAECIRFALWTAVGMLLVPLQAMPIHSSTIAYRGKAVLFLGESGTGKSTHTKLWMNNIEGSRLLNDDSPFLAIENGTAMVYGSPWSGKTHCYHNVKLPIAGIVRLSQAPYNKISRLSVLEAFGALQPSCPPGLSHDNFFTDRIVAMISTVLQSVSLYHLACLPDADAAKLSFGSIFQES